MDDSASAQIDVGVIGAAGPGGRALVKLLAAHPQVNLACLADDQTHGKPLSTLYPQLANQQLDYRVEAVDLTAIAERCQVVFLVIPNGNAHRLVPTLLEHQCRVIDLSADYRFSDLSIYQAWYGYCDRTDAETAARAIYGLPELCRNQLPTAQLVSCPGDLATASLLATAPLLKQGLVEPESIVIDAKAGMAGRGILLGETQKLTQEMASSLMPYWVAHHRHTPEIEALLGQLARHEVVVQFTPHLLPVVQGILTTTYATLRDPGLVRDDLNTIYGAFYRYDPWITVLENGIYPQTSWSQGSNRCHLGVEVDSRTGRVIVMAAIDTVLRGKVGQAVQCFNLMHGLGETVAIP